MMTSSASELIAGALTGAAAGALSAFLWLGLYPPEDGHEYSGPSDQKVQPELPVSQPVLLYPPIGGTPWGRVDVEELAGLRILIRRSGP